MVLEKFIRTKQNYEPAITIRKNGTIAINRWAVENFPFNDKPYVTLYFDKKEMIIGIKPTDDATEGSVFKISREKGKTPTISCQAFLNSMGISYREGSWLYAVTWDEKREMMLVKVS